MLKLRLIMDEVFGKSNFQNEIQWYYYNKLKVEKKSLSKSIGLLSFIIQNQNKKYNLVLHILMITKKDLLWR